MPMIWIQTCGLLLQLLLLLVGLRAAPVDATPEPFSGARDLLPDLVAEEAGESVDAFSRTLVALGRLRDGPQETWKFKMFLRIAPFL